MSLISVGLLSFNLKSQHSGELKREAPGEVPGEAPGKVPGGVTGLTPGEAPGLTPGEAPGEPQHTEPLRNKRKKSDPFSRLTRSGTGNQPEFGSESPTPPTPPPRQQTHHWSAGRCSPGKCSAAPPALSFPRASCCGRAEPESLGVCGGSSAARSSVPILALCRPDGEAHGNRALWQLGAH